MSKFSDIQKGTRARRRIRFPLANTPGVLVSATPEQIEARKLDQARVSATSNAVSTELITHAECAVRVLEVFEHEDVYAKALARTKALGGEEGEHSHIYNYAVQLFTVAIGCIDPDSPEDKPELYFGETVEQAVENIGKSPHLSKDTLAMLAQAQETFQNECSPQSSPGHEMLLQCIEETARDARFPLSLEPAAHLILTHTLAVLHVNSRMDKSISSSPSTSEPESLQKSTSQKPNRATRRTSDRSGKKR